MSDPLLEVCKRTDPRYLEFRNRHYVPNRGSQGQQVHFLVRYHDEIVGIISGGSPVWSVADRDRFFALPKEGRGSLWLPAIVNNTVFRLEFSEPNLGTRTLAIWRRAVEQLWPELYGIQVLGYETFIIEAPGRVGAMYRADNWTSVGSTAGRTKVHATAGGISDKSAWADTDKKLVLCRWAGKRRTPDHSYVASWRRSTPEEKALDKERTQLRAKMLGRVFG